MRLKIKMLEKQANGSIKTFYVDDFETKRAFDNAKILTKRLKEMKVKTDKEKKQAKRMYKQLDEAKAKVKAFKERKAM